VDDVHVGTSFSCEVVKVSCGHILVDSFGNFFDNDIKVDKVMIEACPLVDEACSDLVVVDRLSGAVSLDDTLHHRLGIDCSIGILGVFHVA
jgi:hypothetical protein